MGEPKPLASLSSGLLARKGQARPAMRPQGFGGFGAGFGGHDDLGWNDMGHDHHMPVSFRDGAPIEPVPPVLRQRQELAEEFADAGEHEEYANDEAPPLPLLRTKPGAKAPAPAVAKPAAVTESKPLPTVAIARARKAAKGRKGKAAFTLRLDAERHLKLRLACAIGRESAQSIVTEALDRYLDAIPELEELAGKVPTGRKGKGAHTGE